MSLQYPPINNTVPLPGYFVTCSASFKVPNEATSFIIESFYIFSISIWDYDNTETNMVGIKCNNCNETTSLKFENEELNEVINTYVLHYLFQNISLSWIVDNNNHLQFEMWQHCYKWMKNGQCFNTIIFSQLSGQNF